MRTEVGILVLGSGLFRNPKNIDGYMLSWDERMRLLASLQLHSELAGQGKSVGAIVVCGGSVYKDCPPLYEFERRYLIRKNPALEPLIKVSGESTSTVSDIRTGKKVLADAGIYEGFVISNRYHLVAQVLSQRHGLTFVPAEDLLKRRHPYMEIVQKIEESQTVKNLIRSQGIKVLPLLVPVVGERVYELLSAISSPRGASVSDFDPYGLQKL